MDRKASLRNLPSVERVLGDDRIAPRINVMSRRGITRFVRETIESLRERLAAGGLGGADDPAGLLDIAVAETAGRIESLTTDRQKRVVNATGVILHTNLGRAVLGPSTASAVMTAASRYTDLEMDIASGSRTNRSRRVLDLLRALTGCGGAHVVNNNAAAVLLAVDTFARGGAVAISRGELVEIGGSFRLPEILARAAGRVIEVGTTNRTHLEDYRRAVDEGATLLLKVHTSNYRVVGYTNEVPIGELAALGREKGVPVMYDQGSGILFPLEVEGFEGEESLMPILDSGVDLVSFSGDKVLGGAQSGIIVGEEHLVGRMRENHLSRALRIDKMTLAGLEQVLVHYWKGELDQVPALAMMTADLASLRSRTEAAAAKLADAAPGACEIEVVEGETSIGGGSYPINPLKTALMQINLTAGETAAGIAAKGGSAKGGSAAGLERRLRELDPPVLVRVRGNSIFVDLRTVSPDEEDILIDNLATAIRNIKERE